MLMIEVVANSMMIVIALALGLRWLNLLLHRLVEQNFAKVASIEARRLDDEWRDMSDGV